jgi:hypothetical protein
LEATLLNFLHKLKNLSLEALLLVSGLCAVVGAFYFAFYANNEYRAKAIAYAYDVSKLTTCEQRRDCIVQKTLDFYATMIEDSQQKLRDCAAARKKSCVSEINVLSDQVKIFLELHDRKVRSIESFHASPRELDVLRLEVEFARRKVEFLGSFLLYILPTGVILFFAGYVLWSRKRNVLNTSSDSSARLRFISLRKTKHGSAVLVAHRMLSTSRNHPRQARFFYHCCRVSIWVR